MEELQNQVLALTAAVGQLNATVTSQQAQLNQLIEVTRSGQPPAVAQASPPVQLVPHEPKMPLPVRFSGERSDFDNFKHRCLTYFQVRPLSSGSEIQKIALIKTLLQGDSQTWAFGLPPGHEALTSVEGFFGAMAVIYADPDVAATAARKLRSLKQGRRSAEDYAAEFRRWSVSVKWGRSAILEQFLLGLSEAVSDVLVSHPEPDNLESAITLSIKVDRRLRYRRQTRFNQTVSSGAHVVASEEEPMQIGYSRLSPTEKLRRRHEGLCMYCGEKGHFVQNCSSKKKAENSHA